MPKHNGEPRRTVDFKELNKASKRQTHHSRSPFRLAMEVPRSTKKSILDVWNAYHSVMIRKEDRDKTAFIMEEGKYRYLRTRSRSGTTLWRRTSRVSASFFRSTG